MKSLLILELMAKVDTGPLGCFQAIPEGMASTVRASLRLA